MKNDVIMNHSVMSKDGDQFDLEDRLHRRLSEEIEAEIEQGTLADIPPKDDLSVRLDRIIDSEDIIQAEDQKATLERSVLDRILGLGPLEPLLEDASITEVMVNDPSNIFVERNGQLELTDIYFRDEAQLRHVINRIVAPIGRRIDESSPLVDARLPDGSRVNAIIPPLAIGGPALTIRKFSREPFTLDRLIELGTINHEIADFLETCVKGRVSLIISGGTGSGKTTTLNALG